MDFFTELTESNKRAIERRRATMAFAKTPLVKGILRTCEFLKNHYEMQHYLALSEGQVYVNLLVRNLKGLKDERLAYLLSSLLAASPTEERTEDYPAGYNRDYIFTWRAPEGEGYTNSLVIRIAAYFKEDSDTCKKVIVGYTAPDTEPRPIYKLECVDQPPAEAQPEAQPQ